MNNLSLSANNELDDRGRRYHGLLDFYRGKQWPATRREDRRLTFNYAAAVVDKLTAYLLNGMSVRAVALDESAQSKSRAGRAQCLLDQAARGNVLDRLDCETETDAAVATAFELAEIQPLSRRLTGEGRVRERRIA